MIALLVITGVATAATHGGGDDGNDRSARNVADIVLIDQHQTRYTYLIDSRRPDEWASLWTRDGVFEEKWQDANGDLHEINGGAGCKMTGQAEIAQYLRLIFASVPMNLPRPAGPAAGHRIVDRLIDVSGDTATLSSRGGFTGFYWQYETTLVRTNSGPDGGWKFQRVLAILNYDYSAPHCNANGPVA